MFWPLWLDHFWLTRLSFTCKLAWHLILCAMLLCSTSGSFRSWLRQEGKLLYNLKPPPAQCSGVKNHAQAPGGSTILLMRAYTQHPAHATKPLR